MQKPINYKKTFKLRHSRRIEYAVVTFDLLMPFALSAYKNEDNEKAFLMFNVIASLYPKSYSLYVFYDELLEKIKGAEEALNFYKFITGIFQEPELCFVAGEWAMRHQEYENAKNYLIQAYKLYQQRPRTNDGTDLRNGIQKLLLNIAKIFVKVRKTQATFATKAAFGAVFG